MAALPIPNDLNAEALLIYLEKILHGLLTHNIKVTSYAADGTEVERSLQRLLKAKGQTQLVHTVKNPQAGYADIKITIGVFDGQPISMVQDSSHGLKTDCNNLFSGARLLTFGNHVALYCRVHEGAFEEGSPLYHRDVKKLDRQDDNAATQLHSAGWIKFLSTQHPDWLLEIVYFTVCGDFNDAWQSRSMPHSKQVKLVLHASYFFDMWATYLERCGYNKALHYVSREYTDIIRFLIDGLISLIIIYRDHIDGDYPLLPWLHSTEPCEHVFGEARQQVKNFTMLDFYYMYPKLTVKLREAVLRGQSSDPKARASGYCHKYFDTHGINLLTLATFSSNEDIERVANKAAQEAESLVRLLGVNPAQLLRHMGANLPPTLPSINMWYQDSQSDVDDDESMYDEEENDIDELQALIEGDEHTVDPYSIKTDDKVLALTFALLALTADEHIKV